MILSEKFLTALISERLNPTLVSFPYSHIHFHLKTYVGREEESTFTQTPMCLDCGMDLLIKSSLLTPMLLHWDCRMGVLISPSCLSPSGLYRKVVTCFYGEAENHNLIFNQVDRNTD